MANYQVPTEGACSLNLVNTVYFTVQYTLTLSWITAYNLQTSNKVQVMVSVMTLGVWPVSGVHLSAPLDYAPQQGPFQSNQIYQLRIKMHINNICKRLYQRTAQPNTCYNILFEKPHACLGHETPMWKQGRTRLFEGLKPYVKTWQPYSLGSNSGSSKPWLLSSEHEEM